LYFNGKVSLLISKFDGIFDKKKAAVFSPLQKNIRFKQNAPTYTYQNRECHFCSDRAKLLKAIFLKLLIYSYILTITNLLNLLYSSIQAVKDISKDFPSFAEMNNCVVNPAE
jgi:hypothetical protein